MVPVEVTLAAPVREVVVSKARPEVDTMHDEHFLTRLDRLDERQVEDALALYYDAELVKYVLAHTLERGHGDRIAISIDDPRQGPFIVVTQSGDFVTALGRGMSPGDLPVVPRAVWDSARRDKERVHEAFAEAHALSRGRLPLLSRELHTRGPWVSREVMRVMLTLAKVLPGPFLRSWSSMQCAVSDALKMIKTRDRWQSLDETFFADAGRTLWKLGHFSVLVGATRLKELPADDPLIVDIGRTSPSSYCSRLGVLGPLIRCLWLTGKLGPILFAGLKERFRTAPAREYALDAALGMVAIGRRFSRYRGEIRKILTIAERPGETREELMRRAAGLTTRQSLDLPSEVQREALIEFGRAFWHDASTAGSPESSLYFAMPEAVPDDLALPTFGLHAYDLWRSTDGDVCGVYIPATFLLEAEEMYLPKRYADLMPTFDFANSTRPSFERQREERTPVPVKAAPKIGRNEACPCGSGKKSKRCCAV